MFFYTLYNSFTHLVFRKNLTAGKIYIFTLDIIKNNSIAIKKIYSYEEEGSSQLLLMCFVFSWQTDGLLGLLLLYKKRLLKEIFLKIKSVYHISQGPIM